MEEFHDEDRKVNELTGDVMFTGIVLWSRFMLAMKNANIQTKTQIASTHSSSMTQAGQTISLAQRQIVIGENAASFAALPVSDDEDDSEDDGPYVYQGGPDRGGMIFSMVGNSSQSPLTL